MANDHRTEDRPSNLPQLLRDAERRVNEHVWGDRRAIVSIPADVSRDVDILLLTAADEIDALRRVAKAARAFVDNFPSTYVDDGNCRKEWRELNEALTDGDAT